MKNLTTQEWAAELCPLLDQHAVVISLVQHDVKDFVVPFEDATWMPTAQIWGLVNEQFFTDCFITDADMEKYPLQDIRQIYLDPLSRCMARGIDQILLDSLSLTLTGRAGPCRTGTLRQPDVRECLRIACRHFDDKKAFKAGRYLILSPEGETEALKAGCFDAATGKCVGGFQGYLSYSLGSKMDGENYITDESAPSAYAWHRNAISIVSRRLLLASGWDTTFISGNGIGFQVGTTHLTAKESDELGGSKESGLWLRAVVLMGVEVLDPSLIAIFQDLP